MTHWPIQTLLPHSGDMVLLDEVLDVDAERIVCRRIVRADGLYDGGPDGMPAWCGVELMAQCIAAWAGWHARAAGKLVQLGFLLGTRHYRCSVDAFPLGGELHVEAVRGFHDDNGMAVFACRIDGPNLLAEARLTVFSPPDTEAFLTSTAQGHPHD